MFFVSLLACSYRAMTGTTRPRRVEVWCGVLRKVPPSPALRCAAPSPPSASTAPALHSRLLCSSISSFTSSDHLIHLASSMQSPADVSSCNSCLVMCASASTETYAPHSQSSDTATFGSLAPRRFETSRRRRK
ncbi:hypothetical protein HDK77DRAFT_285976 [Phyllosticta capitalensis]|uniref:Secreted protein n=1 Tax=Phyllosticta capitalensis TaxID=121624 RepID=A0ABR1YG58_9PEZI